MAKLNIPRVVGVYLIRNNRNNKGYVGSSSQKSGVFGRCSTHRKMLRQGRHDNAHLQAAWLQDGEMAFEFLLLEAVPDVEQLLTREQYWMDYLGVTHPAVGYNMCPRAGSCRGLRPSAETLARRRLALSGITKDWSAWAREELRQRNKDRVWTVESRAKISKSSRAWVRDEAYRQRMSQVKTGFKHSAASKKKMSEACKGRVFTEEHKANISRAKAGTKWEGPGVEARKAAARERLQGKTRTDLSPEARQRIGEAVRQRNIARGQKAVTPAPVSTTPEESLKPEPKS